MMKVYRWHGHTYQIAEEDLFRYPGAVPVEPEVPKAKEEKPEPKKKAAPKNKSRQKKPETK